MKAESMTDIELTNIHLDSSVARQLSSIQDGGEEVRLRTDHGVLLVVVQGDRTKPAIITNHDLGLNHVSNFQAFFNFTEMRTILANFCVYHINAPGQEENAEDLPDDFVFPTMDELAEQINFLIAQFGIKSFIGFGVGAGANVLARYALANPRRVDALILINCASTQAGWVEWGYQKMNASHLWYRGMTQAVLDYLMWHHFGRTTEDRNHDLVQVYRNHFSNNVNAKNLSMFIDSYVRRTDLNIARDGDTIDVPILNITGALSPHVDDTITLNARLNPKKSTWMKLVDCGMVLEEQPAKISEATKLFLQGEGFSRLK